MSLTGVAGLQARGYVGYGDAMSVRTDRRPEEPGAAGPDDSAGDETLPDEEAAAEHIHGICLKTGPPRRVGVELEWLVRDARDPALPVPAERIAAAVSAFGAGVRGLPSSSSPGELPSGAFLTSEPGGQLELSSLPADSLADCVSATAGDLATVRAAVADAGLELAGFGLDPYRPPRRIVDLPRYAAMEGFFDRSGPDGRAMMCSSASVQVCLDAGDDSDGTTGYRHRWRLAHAIGPVLVAAFANSPLQEGAPAGFRSARQRVWGRMDPGRTRAPRGDGADPRDAWVRYALDAEVMCMPDPGSPDWAAPPGLTLRDWVRGDWGRARHNGRRRAGRRAATTADLDYHLTTLFPPVRPHGYLELRMIDAQPGGGWVVPLAVATALLDDARASEEAMAAVEPLDDGRPWWLHAARQGPSSHVISRASRACFAAARAALDRMGTPEAITGAVDAFMEDYVLRDRCPADDLDDPGRRSSPAHPQEEFS
jgi:ergothioneine biosynthesis glutamate--cysteine ligase EgtA